MRLRWSIPSSEGASLFKSEWASIGAPRDSRQRIFLPFLCPPPQTLPRPSQITVLSKPDQIQVVDKEMEALLPKGAIRRVSKTSRGLVLRIFVVPKKDGGWRPIINLKWLNQTFLDMPHFRMDTALDVDALLRCGDWAASIDLKDADFHVFVNRDSFGSDGEAASTSIWFFHSASVLRRSSSC